MELQMPNWLRAINQVRDAQKEPIASFAEKAAKLAAIPLSVSRI
jgi:hypothetical protein